jgi:ketosteroid isomerase-like protein
MRRSLARFAAVLICIPALLPAQGSEHAALQQQVMAAERAFAQTMAARDHAAFAAFLSNEAIFFNGEEPIRGKDAVIAAWKPFYDGPDAPFSWEPDRVEVIESGTLALSTGPVRDPSGKVIGRFNSIWRRDSSGAWRVVFDKGSPVCPPRPSPTP